VARRQDAPGLSGLLHQYGAAWFVVLTFDPFGQGERGISTRDHRRIETLLVGIAQQGVAEYETQCALEYLLSRKEVDPQRIGMTGASGGGYNTWITSALDDRIKVAVPLWDERFLRANRRHPFADGITPANIATSFRPDPLRQQSRIRSHGCSAPL
jgi:dienelactone hydrolase